MGGPRSEDTPSSGVAPHPPDESRLLLGRQATDAARSRLAMNGTEPAVAIGVAPPLDEAAAPSKPRGDVKSLVALEGEADASQGPLNNRATAPPP
jgi:hypothetical protein